MWEYLSPLFDIVPDTPFICIMAKTKGIYLVLLGAGAAIALQKAGAKAADVVSVGTIRAERGSTNPAGMEIMVIVPIHNRTPITANLESFTGTLYYGTESILNLQLPAAIDIEPGVTDLEFPTFISFADTLGDILELIQSGQYLAGLRLRGMARVNTINIPIDQAIHPI